MSAGIVIPDFDELSHTYSVFGVRYPSVTQILDYMGEVSKFAKSPTHAARGTVNHRILELYDKGTLIDDFLDEDQKRSVEYWHNFCKDFGHKWEVIEGRFAHKELRYAGTIDRYGQGALVDIKTGQIPSSARLQLAGYAMGLTADPSKIERYCVVINPKKHKNYKLSKLYNDPTDLLEWESMVRRYYQRIEQDERIYDTSRTH
jgi:hypothetical protein